MKQAFSSGASRIERPFNRNTQHPQRTQQLRSVAVLSRAAGATAGRNGVALVAIGEPATAGEDHPWKPQDHQPRNGRTHAKGGLLGRGKRAATPANELSADEVAERLAAGESEEEILASVGLLTRGRPWWSGALDLPDVRAGSMLLPDGVLWHLVWADRWDPDRCADVAERYRELARRGRT